MEPRNRVDELTERAKSGSYNDKIIKSGGDQRTIFKVLKNVVLPTNASKGDMAQVFGRCLETRYPTSEMD